MHDFDRKALFASTEETPTILKERVIRKRGTSLSSTLLVSLVVGGVALAGVASAGSLVYSGNTGTAQLAASGVTDTLHTLYCTWFSCEEDIPEAAAPVVATTSQQEKEDVYIPAPTPVQQPTVINNTYPVQERVIERVVQQAPSAATFAEYVKAGDLAAALASLAVAPPSTATPQG